jgi:hypothetical protein
MEQLSQYNSNMSQKIDSLTYLRGSKNPSGPICFLLPK